MKKYRTLFSILLLSLVMVGHTGQKPPEKVTFPNMVKISLLEAPEPSEVDEVNALLQAFQADNSDFSTTSEKGSEKTPKATPSPENRHDNHDDNHATFVLEFKSKEAKGKRQILMPETGEFKLVLEAGPRFEITDKDARDGETRVKMPASTLKTWVHLEEAKDNSSLAVSDELYYVQDTLSKERKKHSHDEKANQWFKLGLRPLPVPNDWYSPDGQTFVLRFKAQQVKACELLLQKQRGEAPFPPGIKQIGTAGGTVELPGVAKLELPAGALNQNTTVKITQITEAPSRGYPGPNPEDPLACKGPFEFCEMGASVGYEFITPLIRIEPFNLDLTQPGTLRFLSLLDPAYSIYAEGGVNEFQSEDINNIHTGTERLSKPPGKYQPFKINKFVYFSKMASYGWLKNNKLFYEKNNSFKTNQTHPQPAHSRLRTETVPSVILLT